MTLTIEDLYQRLLKRANADPSESYTAKLISRGVEKCAQKLGEEAVEAAIAATKRDRKELTAESADLLYHLLTLLIASDIPLSDIMDELDSRTARTGLEEKASRIKKPI